MRGDIHAFLLDAHRDMESIPKTSPVFVQARVMLAKIYLEKRRDRAAYIKCYEAIVESSRDKQSYVMFGEAMMRIQEPLLAVDALKEALR